MMSRFGAVEILARVMQQHLPLPLPGEDLIMCMCHSDAPDAGVGRTLFTGPVFHRRHVAELQLEALYPAQESIDDSNVDLIYQCLHTPPDQHLMEKEEEWWEAELGENPSVYFGASMLGSDAAFLLAINAWAYRRGLLRG